MLSTPSPLSLCAVSHFLIAHGLREQLALWMLFPHLWAHIDWLSAPPKAAQHGVPAAAFCWCCSKKKSEGKKKRGVANHQEASPQPVEVCLFSLSASLAVMRINWVYRNFPYVLQYSSPVFAEPCPPPPPPPHCPADSLHPVQSYLLTPSAQSAVLSHRSHTIQHNRPPNNPVVCGRMHMNLRGLVKKNESTISVVYSYNLTHIFHFTVKESRSKMCRHSSRTS